MCASWLEEVRARGQQNAQAAQSDPAILRRFREIADADQRLAHMQEQPEVVTFAKMPAPKTAPRPSRHAARPQRQRVAARPHTLEERRDDALSHEFIWDGIERTAPPRVAREFGL